MIPVELHNKIKAQLERDEGRRSKLYYDSLNIPTIGIGINLKEGLSSNAVDFLFDEKLNIIFNELVLCLPWSLNLDEARLGALINMAYNLGVPRLLGFKKLLAALQSEQWGEARIQALNSIWSSQVGSRAMRVAQQFETGVWNA